MQAVDLAHIEPVSAGAHRGAEIRLQVFPFLDDGDGSNMMLAVGSLPSGYHSPSHRHNFDQVRYQIAGSSKYGSWSMRAGEAAYFPESVPYGAQEQEEGGVVLTAQFPGDSNAYFMRPDELDAANIKLRSRDPEFGRGGHGVDAEGRKRDGFELAWEAHTGRSIAYAPPRYNSPLAIKPSNFAWRSDGAGRDLRHLGTFGDARLEVLMARTSDEARLGIDPRKRAEFWFLTRGAVRYKKQMFAPHSGFMFRRGEGSEAASVQDAEFLIIRFPIRAR